MHPYKHRTSIAYITLDQSHMLQTVVFLAERNEAEISVKSGHAHFLTLFDKQIVLKPVRNKISDAYQFYSPFVGTSAQFRKTRHRAVITHDLHQSRHRLQSGKTGEIDSGFGVSGSLQNAPVLSVKGVDMTRTTECLGLRCRIGKSADCRATVFDGDSGAASFEFVDSNCKRSAEHRGVVGNLWLKFKFPATCKRHGHAQYASRILEHEIHIFGRYLFCSDYEVTLVLAVLVIDNHHKLPLPEIFKRVFYPV